MYVWIVLPIFRYKRRRKNTVVHVDLSFVAFVKVWFLRLVLSINAGGDGDVKCNITRVAIEAAL